jgi:RNA polymerase primary sigma factor
VAEQTRLVRVPSGQSRAQSKAQRAFAQLLQELGREPTIEEVAVAAGTTVERVRRWLQSNHGVVSLDEPKGRDDDRKFGDDLSDQRAQEPASGAGRSMLRNRLCELLDILSYREREVIKLRYGLGDGFNYSLADVACIFRVSRERIRQIEGRAFNKLQQHAGGELAAFLD